ncbi:MAG TPA: PaaI family thioesterase, partial [Candidatus Binataceae bacterium]|nr:PaaI family thioesterase [Candidatus Binataceae bacterium]
MNKMADQKLSPAEYAAQIQEWARGTALGAHGVRFVNAGEGRARAELEFRPELAPLTGVFHIGAIMTFAEETASAAGMWEFNPTRELRPDLIPLTFQLNFNQLRNAGRGKLMADAEIVYRGRTILVVEVKV